MTRALTQMERTRATGKVITDLNAAERKVFGGDAGALAERDQLRSLLAKLANGTARK